MTKIVLGDADWEGKPIGDGMLKRRRGAIVNTSSAAGRQVSPLLAGYSGAKGFVVMFSKSLNAELAPHTELVARSSRAHAELATSSRRTCADWQPAAFKP